MTSPAAAAGRCADTHSAAGGIAGGVAAATPPLTDDPGSGNMGANDNYSSLIVQNATASF
jgi:hypothetical protein